jgi:Glycosyl transferase family 2
MTSVDPTKPQSKIMDNPLVIVTSFCLPVGAISLPEAVKSAFGVHARSHIISELLVLTEGDDDLIKRLILEVCGCQKVMVVKKASRPSFSELFEYASNKIAENGGMAAILNSDISFGSDEDILRCSNSLQKLSQSCQNPIVYGLTRHDFVLSKWQITLSEECGLPNMLSTDCWLISSPVQLKKAVSYSLGQMNCDLMANYDLVTAGYSLFNPCLDVCIQHHEVSIKSNEFYVEASQKIGTLEHLSKFMASRENLFYKHYGVQRVATDWLVSGYKPLPFSNRSKKLYVRVDETTPSNLLVLLLPIESFASKYDFDLVLVADKSIAEVFEKLKPITSRLDRVYFIQLAYSFDFFISGLLENGYDNHYSIAFVSSIHLLFDRLSTATDFIVLDLGKRTKDPSDATIFESPMVEPESLVSPKHNNLQAGCTLVTSVFRSDEFLEKFLLNIKLLESYDKEIDHIFLVSETSINERRILIQHFSESKNALIIWNKVDPGLYACWNIGISLAQTDYISNANVDDLRSPSQVSSLVTILERKPHIGVACSAIIPFEHYTGELTEARVSTTWYTDQGGEFRHHNLGTISHDDNLKYKLKPHNLPHCMPVWRRALHGSYGFFDEDRYGTFADWAFWLKVTKEGLIGYLHPEPLSHYYVNPDSHNRRGDKLEGFHQQIEAEFLDIFIAHEEDSASKDRRELSINSKVKLISAVEKKLNLSMSSLYYGKHRNSFNALVESLRPLHLGHGGVMFVPFIERYFVWGNKNGEARSKHPRPLESDWVGIIHVPFDSPSWFAKDQQPELVFETKLWKQSLSSCRGLICLSEDLKSDLNTYYPNLPTLALKHPTEQQVKPFEFDAYERNPRLVQIGDWLRKLQAIYKIRAFGHKKLMLTKQSTKGHLDEEVARLGNFLNKSVQVKDFVSNIEYDQILSSSVVLCFLYATAANNVVLECIVRNTPIIINPLPSVVEYLGDQYPLYATTIEMADSLLMDRNRILETSEYLRQRAAIMDLSYNRFQETIETSSFYKNL